MPAEPCAVFLWMRDGTTREVAFASRFLAELYLALVPFVVEPDGSHEVAAAMLSPLPELAAPTAEAG